MWAERAEATLPLSPVVQDLRATLDVLERSLASFDGHPGALLAGEGPGFSGGSRTLWEEAERDVAEARSVFHDVTRLVDDAVRRAAGTDPGATLGQTAAGDHPLPAVHGAIDAVQRALVLARRLEVARNRLLPRARAAAAEAADAGEEGAATRAGDLARRITTDPLAEHESDLHDVEQEAVSAGLRTDRGRFARLCDLEREATDEAEHAASRIAGFVSTGPALRDGLARLNAWLHRIEVAAQAGAGESSGQERSAWRSAADDLEGRAGAASKEARALIAHRDSLRGMYGALNETAARRGQREEPEIDALFHAAEDHLWIAPCDLDVAEAMLATLIQVLGGRGPGRAQ